MIEDPPQGDDGNGEDSAPRKGGRGVPLTFERYQLLVDAFRQNPGAGWAKIGRIAQVDQRTAQRAYTAGLHYDFAATPISKILAEEGKRSRTILGQYALEAAKEAPRRERKAAAAKSGRTGPTKQERAIAEALAPAEEERKAARADAMNVRVAEAMLARSARGAVLDLLETTQELLRGAATMVPLIKQGLEAKGERWTKNPELGIQVIHEVAKITRAAVQAGADAIEMERKLLGDPADVTDPTRMSRDEAIRELEAGAKLLERARRRAIPDEPTAPVGDRDLKPQNPAAAETTPPETPPTPPEETP